MSPVLNRAQRDALFLREMGLGPTWVAKHPSVQREEAPIESAIESSPVLADVVSQKVVTSSMEATVPPTTVAPVQTQVMSTEHVASLDWASLQASVSNCSQCSLCHSRTQTVFGVGSDRADWMVIGEAPGEQEDAQGEPFVGQAGQLLDNMLLAIGLQREAEQGEASKNKAVYIANVLKCRPPENRDPHADEVAHCLPYLQRQIALVQPKLLLLVGRFAAQTLLQTDQTIGKLRGTVHQYQGIPAVVTYHPAYLLRTLTDKAKAWEDLCLARATYAALPADLPTESSTL